MEKRVLRSMELVSFANLVSVYRGQGTINEFKTNTLQNIASLLAISPDRYKAEIRRVNNDERLTTIAEQVGGPSACVQWLWDNCKLMPVKERWPAVTSVLENPEENINGKENINPLPAQSLENACTEHKTVNSGTQQQELPRPKRRVLLHAPDTHQNTYLKRPSAKARRSYLDEINDDLSQVLSQETKATNYTQHNKRKDSARISRTSPPKFKAVGSKKQKNSNCSTRNSKRRSGKKMTPAIVPKKLFRTFDLPVDKRFLVASSPSKNLAQTSDKDFPKILNQKVDLQVQKTPPAASATALAGKKSDTETNAVLTDCSPNSSSYLNNSQHPRI